MQVNPANLPTQIPLHMQHKHIILSMYAMQSTKLVIFVASTVAELLRASSSISIGKTLSKKL